MPTVPVVVIVGRPNVGKSTLFNALTRTRNALVADMPGVTRDRIYGRVEDESRNFILVDTGGLDDADDEVMAAARNQTRQAIEEADLVILLTDARAGILPAGHDSAASLRGGGKPVIHAVDKTDGRQRAVGRRHCGIAASGWQAEHPRSQQDRRTGC